jgi:hypothetical protein
MFTTKTYAKLHKLDPYLSVKISGGRNHRRVISFVDSDGNSDKGDNVDTFGPHVRLYDGLFKILPKQNDGQTLRREVHAMFGPSGCGKTYRAIEIAKEYKRLNPDDKIILISTVNDNPELQKLDPILINVTDPDLVHYNFFDPETKIRVVNDPSKPLNEQESDFQDCLVILDDLEAITDPELEKIILNDIINPLLSTGRHFRTSLIYIKHLCLDYRRTRNLLLEADFMHFFPETQNRQIRRYLSEYLGLDKKVIDYVLQCRSRCVTIHAKYPHCLITNDELLAL